MDKKKEQDAKGGFVVQTLTKCLLKTYRIFAQGNTYVGNEISC